MSDARYSKREVRLMDERDAALSRAEIAEARIAKAIEHAEYAPPANLGGIIIAVVNILEGREPHDDGDE